MDEMHSCLCCLQCPPDKDLTTPYTHLDRTEIYKDMLKDCFNIQMVLDGWGSCGICSLCAGRLRDASVFKLQVQRCQVDLRARAQAKTSVEGSVKPEPEWCEEASCVKEEPPYSEATGEVSGGSEAAVLAGGSEAARLAGVSEAARLAGLYDDHVVKDELVLGPERPHRPCVMSTVQDTHVKFSFARILVLDHWRSLDNVKSDSEKCRQVFSSMLQLLPDVKHLNTDYLEKRIIYICKQLKAYLKNVTRSYSKMIDKYSDWLNQTEVFDLPIGDVFHNTSQPAAESVEYPPSTSGQQHYRKDFNNCSKRSKRRRLEESPVKQEPATLEETELLDSERPVKSEVPDGAAPASGGPAREHCEQEHIMQSPVLLRVERGEKLFKCGDCDYKCSYKSSLQTHQRKHTGEKPFECDFCDYKTGYSSSFLKHQRIHTGEKPFECGYCDYKCRVKSNLQTHQRIHTGEKPFKCGDCEYSCRHKSSLQTHQRKHTREKSF